MIQNAHSNPGGKLYHTVVLTTIHVNKEICDHLANQSFVQGSKNRSQAVFPNSHERMLSMSTYLLKAESQEGVLS